MYVPMRLNVRDVLINEGDPSNSIYVLKSGELEILKYDPVSKSHQVIGHVEAGELFGEMSFLDNLPRSATVRATTVCEVHILNRAEFEKLFIAQDPLIQSLVKTLSERLRKANSKIRL